MSYNMNDEHVCNDCGMRLVQCDRCECCGACCDCDEGELLTAIKTALDYLADKDVLEKGKPREKIRKERRGFW